MGIFGAFCALSGATRFSSGKSGIGGDAGRCRISGIVEQVLHRAALHAGVRTPRALGILSPLK